MATITLVGVGTAATGVNAGVTPTVHASTADGDVVLAHTSIRNSGTGVPVQPTGWSTLLLFGNEAIFGKRWTTGDVVPLFTFTGGAALQDTIAQTATFRGVSLEALVPVTFTSQLNGSAANVAVPALVIPKDRHAVITAAWKQDDLATITAPATMTVLQTTSTTTGDDAAQSWWRVIQTTAANIASGTLTVTGGAAAISRVLTVALKPAPTLTVTEQAVFPPRVLLSVTDLTIGDEVELYRVVSGVRTLVRAGAATATDPSFLRLDAEIPFGVLVSYVAVVQGLEYASSPVTYTLTGGKVALTDAVTGLVAETVILAWPDRTYEPQSSTFKVGGRNVVVAGARGQYTGAIDLFVETTSSLQSLYALLDGCTEGVIQIRQPGGYDGIDSYISVTSTREARFSQDGSDERRIVTLDAVEVEPWAASLEAAGFTYADLETAYTGLTYADLAGDYATYLELAQASL